MKQRGDWGFANVAPEAEEYVQQMKSHLQGAATNKANVPTRRIAQSKVKGDGQANFLTVNELCAAGKRVSESKEDRARVKGNSDSTDVDPFLTVCLSCVSTKKAHVGSWQSAKCDADSDGW
jgi:hypothetical protein